MLLSRTIFQLTVLGTCLWFNACSKYSAASKLTGASDSATLGDPPKLSVGPWHAPIGIPAPSFGIGETYRMYDVESSRVLQLTYTQNAEGGFYTHYVDNTATGATDSNNPYGTLAKPRMTIPAELIAGSVVELRGGPYTKITSWINRVRGTGTAEHPIFIRGINFPRIAVDLCLYTNPDKDNSFMIVEGVNVFSVTVGAPADHVVLRNSEVHGDQDGGGVNIYRPTESTNFDATNALSHIVLYNNTIHDNGIWDPKLAVGDRDIHGVVIGWYSLVDHVWVLDNDIYHNEGDSIQVNAGPNSNAHQSDVHHIYIGRNKLHDNKQTGFALKKARDVIASQNDVHGLRRSTSSLGNGMGNSDDGPESVWFLYNRIHDCDLGFKFSGGAWGTYGVIGNLIYDIHGAGGALTGDWSQAGQAVADWHVNATKYFVNNTIYDTDFAYDAWGGWPGSGLLSVANNLGMPSLAGSGASTLLLAPSSLVTKNIAAVSAKFYDAANADFHLLQGNPAIDNGVVVDVYDLFKSLYGIDIAVDFDGNARPQGLAWDIGAFEYGSGVR